MLRHCLTLMLAMPLIHAQESRALFNGKNLDGWEVRGDGTWLVLKDGSLIGERTHANPFKDWPITREQFRAWTSPQAWLYTKDDFDQFDLHVEYFIAEFGNSGVSIRDTSRAKYALYGADYDPAKTPSHVGYEIQILATEKEKYPSGSVYLFQSAKTGFQHPDDWNSMDIESRRDLIRVKINGQVVAESAGDPGRSKTGPIGLQLHDRFSWVMFRNIRIREVK